MKLNVLDTPSESSRSPWYAGGLNFTCTTCGNCCTGGPGYIWASEEEIERLAAHLGISVEQTIEQYCRKIAGRISFKEKRGPGGHDCIFLEERPAPRPKGKELEPGDPLPLTKRICTIYPVRPLQCRTWPFWPENLRSRQTWDSTGEHCPGMNHGKRHFSREQIESLRDAEDWPDKPPTSVEAKCASLPAPHSPLSTRDLPP